MHLKYRGLCYEYDPTAPLCNYKREVTDVDVFHKYRGSVYHQYLMQVQKIVRSHANYIYRGKPYSYD